MPELKQERVEKVIAELWSEVLGIDDIGVDDDFFDLGGTSLALITVVTRMADRLDIPLDTAIVTEGATISDLTRCVMKEAGAIKV